MIKNVWKQILIYAYAQLSQGFFKGMIICCIFKKKGFGHETTCDLFLFLSPYMVRAGVCNLPKRKMEKAKVNRSPILF